jgi:2,4-dienoyl-CoA reductase-like NADH-dependent reductase (Old Yellow Enzyme family)
MPKTYPHLFKPIQIGHLIVPNRIKYAATEDNLNGHDGFITGIDVEYMWQRAAVNPVGRERKR